MRKTCGLFVLLAFLGASVPVSSSTVARASTPDTTPADTGVPGSDGDGATSEDAAKAIAAARQRANDAADAVFAAQSKLEAVQDDKDRLDGEVVALQKKVDTLQKSVEAVAVSRYIGVGTTGIALLDGNIGPTEQAQTALLVGLVNEASDVNFDDFKELQNQLADKRAAAESASIQFAGAQADFAAKEQTANEEIERLKIVEQGRLQDEAVQRALEAQRQKAIEAAQKAAAEQLKRDQDASAAADGGGSDGGDEGQGISLVNAASAASSGGTTGGGGAGGRSGNGSGVIYGQGEDWVCPIQGPTGFADTFGAPRSGGRLHQGVDMISPRGTFEVAVVDGVAVAKTNTLGGQVIWLTGTDGNKYYYAHLEGYAKLGNVLKGEVIGYVGDTGNAQFSTPHLHFEIHPGGGAAVNPYPTVLANC